MYKYLFGLSLLGIDSLIETYSTQSIIHTTLQHYRKLIDDSIQGKDIDVTIQEETQSPLINGLQKFWSTEEIELIYKLFLIVDNEKLFYLQIIEYILTMKESNLNGFIQKASTTYT